MSGPLGAGLDIDAEAGGDIARCVFGHHANGGMIGRDDVQVAKTQPAPERGLVFRSPHRRGQEEGQRGDLAALVDRGVMGQPGQPGLAEGRNAALLRPSDR